MRIAICARCGELEEIFSHYGRREDLPMGYLCYHRHYREQNREKLKARYERDKEKILARRRELKKLKEQL